MVDVCIDCEIMDIMVDYVVVAIPAFNLVYNQILTKTLAVLYGANPYAHTD